MSEVALNLDKLDDTEFLRFERELELSRKIEKYHREQPNTPLNRTHATATFFMRESLARIINKRTDELGNKAVRSQN